MSAQCKLLLLFKNIHFLSSVIGFMKILCSNDTNPPKNLHIDLQYHKDKQKQRQRLYQDEFQLERTGHFSCKNSLNTQIKGTCVKVNKNTVLGIKKLGFNPNADIYLLSELGQCPHL